MQKSPLVLLCHEVELDAQILALLKQELSKEPRLDSHSPAFPLGDSELQRFEELTSASNCIVIIYTNRFETRSATKGTDEQKQIAAIIHLERLRAAYSKSQHWNSPSKKTRQESDPLAEFAAHLDDRRPPVLIVDMRSEGSEHLPADLRGALKFNLRGFSLQDWKSTNSKRPSHSYRHDFDVFIDAAISCARSNLETRKSEYRRHKKAIFDKIFVQLKHDATEFDITTLRRIFVKTREYNSINSQTSFILVGRKGSGKSTIVDYIIHEPNDTRKVATDVNVNALPLEFIYNIVVGAQHQSDQRFVLRRSKLMEFAWEALVYFCCFEALQQESALGTLKEGQLADAKVLSVYLKGLPSNPEFKECEALFGHFKAQAQTRRNTFFAFALSRAVRFIDKIIGASPNEESEFNYFMAQNMTNERFTLEMFPREVVEAFNRILGRCRRNFMFTLDGFDSHFQEFRQETLRRYRLQEGFDQRIQFEMDWLKGLIGAVRRCKTRTGSTALAGKVDFCITIPKDRFLEVQAEDRDAYEIKTASQDINWNGIELAELLRKRIEFFKDVSSNKLHKPLGRLRALLGDQFPKLPENIPMLLNSGRSVQVPLHQYVLRHTFWRPRDILFLWGDIFALHEALSAQGQGVSPQSIKALVARRVRHVIDFEFVREFKDYFTNIVDVMKLFDGLNQSMTFDEFRQVTKGKQAHLAGGVGSSRADLLEELYGLGFVGFHLLRSSRLLERFETEWIFIFNEGDDILKMIQSSQEAAIRIVIHPIFVEYLSLDSWRETIVCEFSDEYLIRHEARQRGGPI